MSQLQVQRAQIALTGARNAIVSPSEWAKVSGNGVVVLLTEPQNVTLDLGEHGRVIHAGTAK